ncbi:MAG: hypothetical protein ACLFP4_14070, partial [Spirochaetales bacterium]
LYSHFLEVCFDVREESQDGFRLFRGGVERGPSLVTRRRCESSAIKCLTEFWLSTSPRRVL